MKKLNISISSIEPIFEKIEKISKVQRLLISIATLVVLIGASVYFSYVPKYKRIDAYKKEYINLESRLVTAKRNAKQLEKYRQEINDSRLKFKLSVKALPEKKEIPSLVASISQSGVDSGLEFTLFQPKGENVKDFYAEIPVSIKVIGHYHNVAIFFDKVGSLSRIVNIKDIKMAPLKGEGKLITSCTAVTYKFVETGAKVKAGAKKKK